MKRIIASLLCAAAVAGASAADFFSTERSDELLTFGARIGVNTTNRTIGGNTLVTTYNQSGWGTGFDLGVVANLNFRDYLTIQPGLFYESRSGRYTLMGRQGADGPEIAQAGKRNSYNFTIPVMAVIGFNVTDDVRWNVEAGPYVAFVMDSKLADTHYVDNELVAVPLFAQKAATVDFGFKLGIGTRVLGHYYCGVHYMAGCVPAWKDRKIDGMKQTFGGVTKGWVFSLGYDF